MSDSTKTIKVCCAIIEKSNKILAAQRSEKMALPLKWEFPGGKAEEGENEEDCIIREIKEEFDIDIKIKYRMKENIHNYGTKSIKLIPFVCEIAGGEIKVKEHKSILWDKAENMEYLDWAEADVPIYYEYLSIIKDKKI